MAFVTGFEGFFQLARWARRDIKEGHALEKPRWFQWGFYNSRAGEGFGWYVLIRLPSYSMMTPYFEAPPAWHQRCLLFKERLPAGKGGWQMTYLWLNDELKK